jgi:Xaa-Pro dipeptidase
MHDLVVRTLCHELIKIGVLVGGEKELIQLGVYRAFYFHGMYIFVSKRIWMIKKDS